VRPDHRSADTDRLTGSENVILLGPLRIGITNLADGPGSRPECRLLGVVRHHQHRIACLSAAPTASTWKPG
jgi:hypothetical protein